MPADTGKIVLPTDVVSAQVTKMRDRSVISALSPVKPKLFANEKNLIFNPSAEAEIVEEGAAKGSYEIDVKPVEGVRFKVVTTTRVTDELTYADEDDQLEIVSNILDDQFAAAGRALDYLAFHAINPKTGLTLSKYTALTSNAKSVIATEDDVANIDLLADALEDYDINGIALGKPFAGRLRKLRVPATGTRLYPEIPLNLQAGSLDGINAAVSGTVNGRLAKTATKVDAVMGNFALLNWGLVRNITSEIIKYGDPDGAGDLKRYGQVAYRTEAVFAYACLDPNAFAVLKSA